MPHLHRHAVLPARTVTPVLVSPTPTTTRLFRVGTLGHSTFLYTRAHYLITAHSACCHFMGYAITFLRAAVAICLFIRTTVLHRRSMCSSRRWRPEPDAVYHLFAGSRVPTYRAATVTFNAWFLAHPFYRRRSSTCACSCRAYTASPFPQPPLPAVSGLLSPADTMEHHHLPLLFTAQAAWYRRAATPARCTTAPFRAHRVPPRTASPSLLDTSPPPNGIWIGHHTSPATVQHGHRHSLLTSGPLRSDTLSILVVDLG